ncbi:hypothetical protein P7C73_g3702, partial [Tremellales sp. Uapishka_1]
MPSVVTSPVKIDYADYLSDESKGLARSQLKQLRPYFDIPGMISFGGGYPHPSTWPVTGMTLSVPFAQKSVFVPGFQASTPESLLPLEAFTAPVKNEPLNPDLTADLQYGSTFGAPHLVNWMTEHIARNHNPPYADWKVLCTAGNTDGTDGFFRTCFNRGDYCLVEEFAYPGALTGMSTQGIKPLGVPMDGDGITPDALEDILGNWDEATRGAAMPKFILIVPTCSNPTGVTMPEYRKREMYAICRKYNVLICEDDPYCFLQIRPNGAGTPIVPSFLSLDVDGRVIRVDSFSKIVAPGSRCGWLTGPTALVTKIMNSREGTTQCASGFSVAAITAILRAWGSHEGFEKNYLPHISEVYKKRCLTMIALFDKYLPAEACEYAGGTGGMFLWIRLKIESHPRRDEATPEKISDAVFHSFVDEKVLVAPSVYFKAPGGKQWTKEEEAKRIYLRISFSLPPPDVMEEGVKRMAAGLKKEWKV